MSLGQRDGTEGTRWAEKKSSSMRCVFGEFGVHGTLTEASKLNLFIQWAEKRREEREKANTLYSLEFVWSVLKRKSYFSLALSFLYLYALTSTIRWCALQSHRTHKSQWTHTHTQSTFSLSRLVSAFFLHLTQFYLLLSLSLLLKSTEASVTNKQSSHWCNEKC